MCLFFTAAETAEGAERSPDDLVESKRSVAGETTKRRGGKKGAGERLQVSHLCSITIWVDGSLQYPRGALLLFPLLSEIHTYNLKIKRGADRRRAPCDR